jgi:cytosine/adenosine deaminase-related metal-dependent hydrolase
VSRDAAIAEQQRPKDVGPFQGAPRPLKLRGARVTVNAHSAVLADLEVAQGRIQRIVPPPTTAQRVPVADPRAAEVDLTGFLLLPGLVNAHDHLEFSLFPKLGQGPYLNAEQWAKDIYHPESSPIREHLRIPKPSRLWWGGIKNLLCGATSVCHHNEFRPDVFSEGFPVRVVKQYAWSHSLQLGGDISSVFRQSNHESPFVIHLGEGTDAESTAEVFELDRRGLLDARTVIVHGVALDHEGHDLVIRRGAALIWCPGSNLFTLGQTLSLEKIQLNPRTALGSDSSLTAGDLLDQVRTAHELGVPAEQIFDLVTTQAADVLKLQDGEGTLLAGSIADIIAVPDCGISPAATLIQLTADQIELVLLAGVPHLLSRQMVSRLPSLIHGTLGRIFVDGSERHISAPVTRLLPEAEKWLGGTTSLAGKHVRQ